eukprot:TRINITY_DN17653_c0_g1_i7.p2 TRINITY_DN17653_c0_g1~~TRINITY_DN17653_c0_g1_i7.p2  ORF type:complete len:365 (+),score=79.46 TRINITY_DN17653_c0_g1_i7:1629-2723(+)
MEGGVLDGVKVLEWSGTDSSVGGAGRMLVELGAHVNELDPRGTRCRDSNPQLAAQLEAGKRRVMLPADAMESKQVVRELLEWADVFMTNLGRRELEDWGLDPSGVLERHPRLVFCHVHNPWSEACAALGMLATSGVAAVMAGGGATGTPPTLPTECAALLSSMYALAAVGTALFHQARTGKGQLAELSLDRVGSFLNQLITSMCWKDRGKLVLIKVRHDEFAMLFPIPTFASFQTADGVWVQLLGIDLPRHLPPTLRALGIQCSTYPRAAMSLVKSLLTTERNGNFFEKMFPVFRVLNSAIGAAIAGKTYAELHAVFDKHDVWHNPVRTPAQLHHYEQAHVAGAFKWDDGSNMRVVASPVLVRL